MHARSYCPLYETKLCQQANHTKEHSASQIGGSPFNHDSVKRMVAQRLSRDLVGLAVDSNNSLKRRRSETVHTECSLHSFFLTRDITVGNFEAYRCASFSSGGRLGRNKLNSVASLFKMGADDARSRDVTSFGGESVDSPARNASSVDAQKNENR